MRVHIARDGETPDESRLDALERQVEALLEHVPQARLADDAEAADDDEDADDEEEE